MCQWVRIEENRKTAMAGRLCWDRHHLSGCSVLSSTHLRSPASGVYARDIVKLPSVPTPSGDHHFPAWLYFRIHQQVNLLVCILPTWVDSVPSFGFLTFPFWQSTCLVPAGSGSACHLPRAPGRETEKAWFERKPPHLHVAEAVLWWKQCVVLLSTNGQLRPQCEVR